MATVTPDIISLKHERAFATMDADKDGKLSWPDYQKLVDRYLSAYKLGKEDMRARAIQATYQMYWLEMLRHAGVDSDGLTKEQFVMASRLASIDTSRMNVAEGLGHAIFDVIDVDGDNEISKDEYARFLKDVWKVGAPDAIESFIMLDTDGDGRISRHEFLRAMREYFYSNDPGTAGSMLFGHL